MMKLIKISFLLVLSVFISCNPDDDNGVELRDEAEVAAENQTEILEFLQTHYFELEPTVGNSNFQTFQFNEITTETPNATPLIDSEFLKSKTIIQNDVSYTLYYLQVRKGAENEYQPSFADEVVVTFKTETLEGELADETVTPLKLDIPVSTAVKRGFQEGITEFTGASEVIENDNGTVSYSDDYGIGAIFVPSGLAYFANPPISTPFAQYEPVIFSFQLYKGIQADHDNDGIPSKFEDLNNDGFLNNDDNTNRDNLPNFTDPDDDGDGRPTADEIEVNDANGDGIITLDEINFIDSNNDGTPDYLDADI